MCNCFKNKGSPMNCDDYRGLLIGDHAGKVLTGLLQDAVTPAYQAFVGDNQYGAVPGLSTALASHLVRSFMDLCKLMGWSSFILFVDLKKAFDKAIRELVMGWMQGDERERHEVIAGLGIAPPFVRGIVDFIEKEKPVLQQLHLDDKVAELIKSLHTGAWFSIEGCDLVVVSRTGGRQGCRLGAVIFNLGYAVGLHRVRTILCKAGIILKVKCRDGKPFWAATADATLEAPASSAGHDIVEVTYVDDETIMITSSSPHRLRTAIDLTLKTLCDVFDELGFSINFNEGKPKLFCSFVGRLRSLSRNNCILTAIVSPFPTLQEPSPCELSRSTSTSAVCSAMMVAPTRMSNVALTLPCLHTRRSLSESLGIASCRGRLGSPSLAPSSSLGSSTMFMCGLSLQLGRCSSSTACTCECFVGSLA